MIITMKCTCPWLTSCEHVLVFTGKQIDGHKPETNMTASILKQDPNTEKVQNNTFLNK